MKALFLIIILNLSWKSVISQNRALEYFIEGFNEIIEPLSQQTTLAMYKTATNITQFNSRKLAKISKALNSKKWTMSLLFKDVIEEESDPETKRKFRLLRMNNYMHRNPQIIEYIDRIRGLMGQTYQSGNIQYNIKIFQSIFYSNDRKNHFKFKYKDLRQIMKISRNPDELLYAWKSWRDSIGPHMRKYYKHLVILNNMVATANKLPDAGFMKRQPYEVDNLEDICDGVWDEIKPLYEELHGYVRYHLKALYPHLVGDGELIPSHLLGNMWAAKWDQIYKYMVPYPNEPTINIKAELEENYEVKDMFKIAEKFFVSLGWRKLPKPFWNHSLFEQPKKRKVVCHPSAWDMKREENGEPDVRIKMCTKKTQEDFVTIHHEIGHLYYYLFYWNQTYQYRDGANPGFHEAVGDTISLSVQTPEHLYKIGLLKEYSAAPESEINFLMKTALQRIPGIPFSLLMDKWMWDVYRGRTKDTQYTKHWWELKSKYQGIKPPVERTEKDFDPGAKFHIATDSSYIRYFFANILQFTFHKQLCKFVENGHVLHKCSIYSSKTAGKAFREMLALGKSVQWQEVLKRFTGSAKLSAGPLKEYFAPLYAWLKKYRRKHKYSIGWR